MTTIVVVAHPDRRKAAEDLAAEVDARITWDGQRHQGERNHLIGCAENHLRALHMLAASQDRWAVVLEDDARPVTEFRRHLEAALRYAPAPLVGLYLGTAGNPAGQTQQQIRRAVGEAQAWIVADCLIGSVGYAVHRDLIDDLTAFVDDREEELPLRISRWAQARGHDVCYTQPSLVDHTDVETIGRPWRGPARVPRRAWNFGTRECWCTPAVRLGPCPIWSGGSDA